MKYFCPVFATGMLLLLGQSATAQTAMDECEKLKIDNAKLKFENANLKKGIIARSPTTAPVQVTGGQMGGATPSGTTQGTQHQTVQKVDFALVKCLGNAKGQTAIITFLLTNTAANRDVQFMQFKVVDENGDEYQTDDILVGSGKRRGSLATGIPVKTIATVSKILPSVKQFKLVSFEIYQEGSVGRTDVVEFRNVPISWK
ncbi:hypothetical protein QMK33_11260 [Hymenobacter sp. H14-R3]|uniref:hypothetical protein n=1 Tax=Hymenobacter sp. H14-R3 TaxID=3046308 RepID=UPI0024B99094|nr:hypothetical protein [Hymenobacter sp. H14-R3]MDJ0365731.1 hypothetical protein [Hymenobacter sp. H14-R3]